MEKENAFIESLSIRYDRDVFLTGWLTLNYGGSTQRFGGYVLGAKPGSKANAEDGNDTGLMAAWINGVMSVADVDELSKAEGKPIRVKRHKDWDREVIAIGHHTKEIWFNPKEEFAKFSDTEGAPQ